MKKSFYSIFLMKSSGLSVLLYLTCYVLDFIFISKFSIYYSFLVVHWKLKLFYSFQIFVAVSDNIVKLLIVLSIFITYSPYQIFKVPFLCILYFFFCTYTFLLNGMHTPLFLPSWLDRKIRPWGIKLKCIKNDNWWH